MQASLTSINVRSVEPVGNPHHLLQSRISYQRNYSSFSISYGKWSKIYLKNNFQQTNRQIFSQFYLQCHWQLWQASLYNRRLHYRMSSHAWWHLELTTSLAQPLIPITNACVLDVCHSLCKYNTSVECLGIAPPDKWTLVHDLNAEGKAGFLQEITQSINSKLRSIAF